MYCIGESLEVIKSDLERSRIRRHLSNNSKDSFFVVLNNSKDSPFRQFRVSKGIGLTFNAQWHGELVVDADFEEQPDFEEIEHSEFFLTRLQDVDVAPVHELADASETKALIEGMARDDVSFKKGRATAFAALR